MTAPPARSAQAQLTGQSTVAGNNSLRLHLTRGLGFLPANAGVQAVFGPKASGLSLLYSQAVAGRPPSDPPHWNWVSIGFVVIWDSLVLASH